MAGNLFRVDGNVALVTGASRGLGAAMARALAEAGADVCLHGSLDAPSNAAHGLARDAGRRAHAISGDLREVGTATRLVDETLSVFGRLDILVNNAGVIRRRPAADHADDEWDEVLSVNLSSVFRLCRAAGRHMLERASGKIVNVASLLSFQGGVNVPGYAAAKGGVVQLTKALANEWAGRGVHVNAIAPGYMETDNTTALRADATRLRQITERIPAGRWGTPADLAGAVVFLSSPASDYVHGHTLVVDGGWMGR
jgi:2-deoxy-D-gluconate 3-dehydrogenase